jgi:uncharacterized protein YjfI (DUF2170 family)
MCVTDLQACPNQLLNQSRSLVQPSEFGELHVSNEEYYTMICIGVLKNKLAL